jgi:hypothetical protein
MQVTFTALSALFGGLGMFLLFLSWLGQPQWAVYGLVFIGSASCIVISLQHGEWARKR